jgi:hypothetical protein
MRFCGGNKNRNFRAGKEIFTCQPLVCIKDNNANSIRQRSTPMRSSTQNVFCLWFQFNRHLLTYDSSFFFVIRGLLRRDQPTRMSSIWISKSRVTINCNNLCRTDSPKFLNDVTEMRCCCRDFSTLTTFSIIGCLGYFSAENKVFLCEFEFGVQMIIPAGIILRIDIQTTNKANNVYSSLFLI